MPDITLTFGSSNPVKHTISSGDASRMVAALCANRGLSPANANTLCLDVAKKLFRDLKAEAVAYEHLQVPISDIPATQS